MSTNFKEILNKNLKNHAKYIPELTKPVLRTIVQVCVHFLENQEYSRDIYEKALVKLSSSDVGVPSHFDELFAGIHILITSYLRLPKGSVKNDDFKAILSDLQFPDDCSTDVIKVLSNHRDSLSANLFEMKSLNSRIRKFEWRLNISLINTESTKLSRPTIILNFEYRGEFRTIELSIPQFHRMRYTIALILKEMQNLEDRQIMKH